MNRRKVMFECNVFVFIVGGGGVGLICFMLLN